MAMTSVISPKTELSIKEKSAKWKSNPATLIGRHSANSPNFEDLV